MTDTDTLEWYCQLSERVPGWIRGAEARELAATASALRPGAIIVQIGTFFGSAAILLAGARKLCGSGRVHCVDPFDCSGDDYSVPYYIRMLADAGGGPLRRHFERNITQARLEEWV